MRPTFAAALAAAIAFLFASPAAAQSPQTVKIGAALSMTGAGGPYGPMQKAGIQLAVDEINKAGTLKPLTLSVIFEDDGSNNQQAINVYQRFINAEKVNVIIGPTLSTMATAADPIAQQAHVPVLAVSNTAAGITDIGDYIWRDSLMEKQVIPFAVKKVQSHVKKPLKTAALLYGNDDTFTKAGYDVMKKTLDDLGVKIVGTQTFAKPDRDFTPQLTELKNLNPDILMVSALADNASAIVTQARQLGYQGPIMGGNGFNSPAFIKNAGPAAEGVYVGAAWNSASSNPVNQKFLEAMKARGVNPDQFTAQAYSGVYIIADAIRQAGKKAGRDDIKAGFAKVKNLPTPLGNFSFTPTRDADHEPLLQQVKDGKFAVVQ